MLGYFRYNLGNYFRANMVAYFFIILIMVIGVVIGAIAVKILPDEQKLELLSYLRIFFNGLTQGKTVDDTAGLLDTVLFNNAKTIVLMWLLGFTIVGIPFVLFILFIRGFIIGFTVGFLVNEYIAKGLLFALVSVLPHNFFAVPALLATGVSATAFSLILLKRKKHSRVDLVYATIRYTAFCFAMLALMLVASLVEVYISPVFMKIVAGLLVKE